MAMSLDTVRHGNVTGHFSSFSIGDGNVTGHCRLDTADQSLKYITEGKKEKKK